MAAGGSSSSTQPEKLMKRLQLEGNSQMEKLELDMREEVRRDLILRIEFCEFEFIT